MCRIEIVRRRTPAGRRCSTAQYARDGQMHVARECPVEALEVCGVEAVFLAELAFGVLVEAAPDADEPARDGGAVDVVGDADALDAEAVHEMEAQDRALSDAELGEARFERGSEVFDVAPLGE